MLVKGGPGDQDFQHHMASVGHIELKVLWFSAINMLSTDHKTRKTSP